MPHFSEKSIPSAKEMKIAKEHLTDEQKAESLRRERSYLTPEKIERMPDKKFIELTKKLTTQVLGEEYYSSLPEDKEKNNNYIFFPIDWYVGNAYLDQKFVARAKRGGTMLHIGVGPAYLERLLADGFQIPRNHMTLADVEFHNKAANLDSFPKVQLDFFKPEDWDKVGQYDFILFPESFGVGFFVTKNKPNPETKEYPERRTFRFSNEIDQVIKPIEAVMFGKEGATEQLNKLEPWLVDLAFKLIEADVPLCPEYYNVTRLALAHLKDGGEIRMSGHAMSEQEIAYIFLRLKKEHQEYVMRYGKTGAILTITKTESKKEE